MTTVRRLGVFGGLLLLAAAAWLTSGTLGQAGDPSPKQPAVRAAAVQPQAVERTRKTVRMLDDLYKTAVVLITKHYVNAESDLPAGTAAIALFDAMREKGWHDIRLLDATGQPYEDKNVPRDEFEKTAVARLKAGDAYYESAAGITFPGHYALVARAHMLKHGIPVVLQKCTMCHPHYKDARPGEPIGILSYTLPIE